MTDKAKGLRVKNAGGGNLEMYIYDDIGPAWLGMIGAETVRNELKQHPDTTLINLHINSGGGSIVEALGIYNQLNQHRARVEVDIDGLAASSAGWVAMAGDEIRIAENGLIMVHDPWTLAIGDSNELKKQADVLDQMKDSIVTTFAARTGIDPEEISNMMAEETWLSAEEAIEKKFADKMNGCKGVQCNADLLRFKNAPEGAKRLAGARPSDGASLGPVMDESFSLINDRLDKIERDQNKLNLPTDPPPATELGGPSDDELIDQVNAAMV